MEWLVAFACLIMVITVFCATDFSFLTGKKRKLTWQEQAVMRGYGEWKTRTILVPVHVGKIIVQQPRVSRYFVWKNNEKKK